MESEHILRTIQIHQRLLGQRPLGFYQGKPNVNTRRLIVEEGGFLYDSDSYADDLPYWNLDYGKPHLIVPYTLEANDMKFVTPGGFSTGTEFATYLKQTLKFLIDEGKAGYPKMMSVGLHCRIVGRAGRAAGLAEFMDFVKTCGKDVWVCTREEIARHWHENHYPRGGGTMSPERPMLISPVKMEPEENGDVEDGEVI
jgi:peptidoglycan/xylan/chitin deacetylase (PgdA/CDA1 family)